MTLIEIVLIFVIIAWNAFFVSAEYAFVAVRRTRIDELVEEGSKSAKRVRRLLDDPARFISAFQVAITLSSLALGAVAHHQIDARAEYWRSAPSASPRCRACSKSSLATSACLATAPLP